MNEIFGALIVAASIQEMNKTLQSKGFSEYKDLVNAIRQLDIEIAKAKDESRPHEEKERLRNEYLDLQRQYDEAIKAEKEKEKKISAIAIIVGLIALAIIIVVTILLVIN